jgi:hypothetical protein
MASYFLSIILFVYFILSFGVSIREKKEPPSSTLLTDQSRRCGYVICVCVCVSVCSVNVCVCE